VAGRAHRLYPVTEVEALVLGVGLGVGIGHAPTARFVGNELDETLLRERCRHAYATHYRSSGVGPPTLEASG
jgi:hypothetical protein